MSNVVYLHGQPVPVTRFLRVSEHRRLEQLLEADKLPYGRFVVEAGWFSSQKDLVKALKQRGHELVLDTNVAELSAIAKFPGQAKNAPWANREGILTEAQLKPGSNTSIIVNIAHFAVANGFARVHSPTHFISGPTDSWFNIDLENCLALRRSLDAEGGKSIAVDFPLMIPNSALNDNSLRREIIAGLRSLPIDSVWARISGFGSGATPASLRKYISSVQEFHTLGLPIVADGVGALSALAIIAFGAASGLSYGVAAKERFDASLWNKPPKINSGGGGRAYSYLLPGIDSLLRREEADAIVNAPGGRRLISCEDRSCCPHGYEDTAKDPKGHFLRQRAFSCDAVSAVPEPVRAQHFLDKDLAQADRKARQISKLKLSDEKLVAKLVENAKRLDRMREVLGSLEKLSGSSTRAKGFSISSSDMGTKRDRR